MQRTVHQLKKATEKANEDIEAKKNQTDKKLLGQIDNLKETIRSKEEEMITETRRLKEENRQLKERNIELGERGQQSSQL